jgi:hypothetical protein
MYSFTLNYVLGVGSLGLPFAMYGSGGVLGVAALLFVAFTTMLTVNWVVEVIYRVNQLSWEETHMIRTAGESQPLKPDIYEIRRRVEVPPIFVSSSS